MLGRFVTIACIILMTGSAAGAAPEELSDFQECRGKPLICYEYVAQIRTTQLSSERQRLYVEREKVILEDWQAHRRHRIHALWSQYIQTWILLFIGIIVVAVGLSMSWLHMTRGIRDETSTENALEIGSNGLRLSSPVIGLFVFGASIWFFTIYIDKVYALSLLPAENPPATQTTDLGQADRRTESNRSARDPAAVPSVFSNIAPLK